MMAYTFEMMLNIYAFLFICRCIVLTWGGGTASWIYVYICGCILNCFCYKLCSQLLKLSHRFTKSTSAQIECNFAKLTIVFTGRASPRPDGCS